MKLKLILIFAMLVISLPMLSCVVTSRAIGVEISCEDFSENPHSIRNEFQVEVGDKITVKLCSNPSTGFQWKYGMTGEIVLQAEDHDFEEPKDENVLGAAAKEVWTFEAIDEGATEVLMAYSRSWEVGEEAEWTYVLNVVVK
ncbi:protease inhibitor I42 family protein [Chloroflexota bacterium]